MKRYKFDAAAAAVTFAGSAVALTALIFVYRIIAPQSWIARGILIGLTVAVTACAGFGALCLLVRSRRKVRVKIPPMFAKGGVIFLLLIFLLGFFGQTVYSAHIVQKRTVEADTEIVLLMDSSYSMEQYEREAETAAGTLIDSMQENAALALGMFTTEITQSWPLEVMDKTGKKDMSSRVKLNIADSGTSLTKALRWAYDTLQPDVGSSKNLMTVIISDGNSPIYPEAGQMLADAGVKVYSVRLSDKEDRFTQDFVDYVKSTGGFDTVFDDPGDKDALKALTAEFGGVPEEDMSNRLGPFEFADEYVLYDGSSEFGVGAFQLAVRFAFFLLLGLLVQLLCFRKITLPSVAFCMGGAVAATFISTLCGQYGLTVIAVAVIALMIYTVFAMIPQED